MNEEGLQLLITLDDPGDGPDEDTFHHLHAKNNLEYWLSQRFATWRPLDPRAEAVDDDSWVTFGQGDWTCTLSRLTGITDEMNGMNIDICTVTRWENGAILEQKVFYDLAGMQNRIGSGNHPGPSLSFSFSQPSGGSQS